MEKRVATRPATGRPVPPRGARRAPRFLAAGAAVLAVLASACLQPTETAVAAGDLMDIDADMVLYGMVDFITSDGVRQGRIEADTAWFYNDSSVVRMDGVHMVVFNEDGSEKATVRALQGRLNRATEEMTGIGEVVAEIAAQGGAAARVIESPVLHYSPQEDRIWSDTSTVYREGGRVTRGSCFSSDLEGRNVRVCSIRGSAGATVP